MDMIPHQIFIEHIYSLLLDSSLTCVNSTSITGVKFVNESVTFSNQLFGPDFSFQAFTLKLSYKGGRNE